ncbi:BppU family phage baseplate upper protein [Clostridium perfringens]|uniref:BppU family phage baseplate upper protein n=1 Tax=Clostridium perfringens TaxID=1502 RepID=UPI00096AAC54|nr:BppU family phage baseplate upper protein [Clostridium perfringens]
MKEIFIDINDYNKSFITATENDNNSDIYKIIITEDARRFDLTGKTVQMAYAISYTDKGDILNLNVTNPTEGEITLEITNELTRKDGDYTCQLLILGENEYRRHSKYYFNLSIRENLFNKISGEIIESPSIGILQELVKKAEFLNTQLENNNNVAESLNTNLAENIKLADPLNTSLGEKIPEAATKKTELESSIVKAKEFIDGLDGSQNIPQIRLDVTELQNGLKSNQALAYKGSSINAENTLEGRTEGMVIKGRTLINMVKLGSVSNVIGIAYDTLAIYSYMYNLKNDTDYTIIFEIENKTDNNQVRISLNNGNKGQGFDVKNGINIIKIRSNAEKNNKLMFYYGSEHSGDGAVKNVILLEGDWTNKPIPEYFESIKSFGQQEDKISILSSGKNRCDGSTLDAFINGNGVIQADRTALSYIAKVFKGGEYSLNKTGGDRSWIGYFTEYPKIGDTAKIYNGGGKITIPDKGYIVAYVSSDKNIVPVNNVIVSEGSVPSEYTIYKEDKKDILISAPLRSVYDVQDIMYEDNGQVKVNRVIGEHLVTGDENFITELRNDYLYGYFTLEGSKAGSGLEAICNQFKYIDGLWNKDNLNVQGKEGFDLSGSNSLSFQLPISKLETADTSGLKKYFKNLYNSNNPVIVYYQLATPTIEIVENCVDIDLDTYQEKTYFNILNSLPGALDFRVPSNLGSVIQNMAKEINNIWDVIDMLVAGLLDTKKDLARKTIKNNLK